MHNFLDVMKTKGKSLNQVCNESVDKIFGANKQKRFLSLRAVVLCFWRNIPLCSYRVDSSYFPKHCSNFPALLDLVFLICHSTPVSLVLLYLKLITKFISFMKQIYKLLYSLF